MKKSLIIFLILISSAIIVTAAILISTIPVNINISEPLSVTIVPINLDGKVGDVIQKNINITKSNGDYYPIDFTITWVETQNNNVSYIFAPEMFILPQQFEYNWTSKTYKMIRSGTYELPTGWMIYPNSSVGSFSGNIEIRRV